MRRAARVWRIRKRITDVIVWRDRGPRRGDGLRSAAGRRQRRGRLWQLRGQSADRDGGVDVRRCDERRVVLTLIGRLIVMVIAGGVRRRVAVNDRAFVVLPPTRRPGVQMQERRGGRAELHAQAHEQDEAEPLHLPSIVADLEGTVKKRSAANG